MTALPSSDLRHREAGPWDDRIVGMGWARFMYIVSTEVEPRVLIKHGAELFIFIFETLAAEAMSAWRKVRPNALVWIDRLISAARA